MEYELLASLPADLRQRVVAAATRRRFAKGMVLFHEGDPGESLHLLVTGRVAIRMGTPQGDVATLAVLGPGAAFGEQALIDAAARRTATALALERVESMSLHRQDFLRLRAEDATVDRLLIEQLAAQVRRLSDRLAEALYVGADKRVMRRLLDLDEVFAGGPVTLTQEDVAAMAGTTRPTVNRVMQALVADGVVELGRARFTVADRPALARRAR